jgi:hypothetical protein
MPSIVHSDRRLEMKTQTVLIAICMLGVTLSTAAAQTNPAGPVTNGDFEQPFAPELVVEPFRDTPLDTCYGIGHQALWGSESTQSDATGTEQYDDLVPPTSDDPERLQQWATERVEGMQGVPDALSQRADAFAENPEGEAREEKRFQVGPDNCVWGPDTGYDVVYLTPVERIGARTPTTRACCLTTTSTTTPSTARPSSPRTRA